MAENEDKLNHTLARIWALVEPVVGFEGCELIEVQYRREAPGWVLRLYIDREGGVAVDDCAKVSQLVSDLLDVNDPIDDSYHLEVSSPGFDRPLRLHRHFEKNIGKIIEARTTTPIQKRKKIRGTLLDSKPESITLNCEGQIFEIPLNLLERARLCYFDSLEK